MPTRPSPTCTPPASSATWRWPSELTDDDGERRTAACPEWRVKDVYAHLAGLCADVVEGRIDGAGIDEWTGRQVEARKDRHARRERRRAARAGPGAGRGAAGASRSSASPSTSGPTSRTCAARSASPAAATCRSWRGPWR